MEGLKLCGGSIMLDGKALAMEKQANSIIKNLKKRNIEGYYYSTAEECVEEISNMIPKGSIVTWGGSETIRDIGLTKALYSKELKIIDRAKARKEGKSREVYSEMVMSDYFLMSTNALTLEGELINIDGNGDRVACLITGPEHVIVVCGVNKIVANRVDGVARVHNMATPPNAIRLGMNSPCATTGVCADCHSKDCLCCQEVITRHSRVEGRIKVFIIGENLGF